MDKTKMTRRMSGRLAAPIAKLKRTCTATNVKTGKRCQSFPIAGGSVCRFHGGAAPNVKAAAARRLMILVDPSIEILERALKAGLKLAGSSKIPSVPVIKVAQDLLDRAGLKTPDESVGAAPMDYSIYTDQEIEELERLAIKQRTTGPSGNTEGEG